MFATQTVAKHSTEAPATANHLDLTISHPSSQRFLYVNSTPIFMSIKHIGGFTIRVNRQNCCAGRTIPFEGRRARASNAEIGEHRTYSARQQIYLLLFVSPFAPKCLISGALKDDHDPRPIKRGSARLKEEFCYFFAIAARDQRPASADVLGQDRE